VAFAFDPAVLVSTALLVGFYFRAVRILARRGYTVAVRQQVAWYGGVALITLALVGPAGALADRLMVAHMIEHLLIADLAAPLLLVGLRTPVLQFLLPRPALVTLARRRRLRRAMRVLRLPPVAIGVYVLVLYGWHLRPAFEGAVRNDLIHVLQHQSFIAISLLVWWPGLQPERRRMPGHLWKIGHIFSARLISIFLGMAFVFGRHSFYPAIYGSSPREYGLSPLADQQLAGGAMMSLDIIIITFALCLFFWRSAQDFDRAGRATPLGVQLVTTAAAIAPATSAAEITSSSRPVGQEPGEPGRESPSAESRTAHAASRPPAT